MQNTQFEIVMETLKKMDKKLDMLLYEDEVIEKPKEEPPINERSIYTMGQRVPYNRLDGDQMFEFRNFLAHVRMNSAEFSEREVDYASFADKTFEDVRLSDNAKRILESAYYRTYKRNWPFTFIKGYLHKLGDDKAWSWADGIRD